ncbi:MAG TPA: hypothetical protein PK373_10720, partial [Sedimentisphaerales bacterium]|nr:hypothetical protein [Sedimentisphaerales bacterium]
EYREGKGMVLFCQMDVTGRTETDPAAQVLTANLLEYVFGWKPSPRREALYAGDPVGKRHLEKAGFRFGSFSDREMKADRVLVVVPGGKALEPHSDGIAAFLKAGGCLLALGWTQQDADAILPFKVSISQGEHINACFDPPGLHSPLAGVGPADVHNRDPREIALVDGGVETLGDGVLAIASSLNVVFCQLAPWQFEYAGNYGLKKTFRRASFLATRILANLGANSETPLLTRFSTAVGGDEPARWLRGFYLDEPEEWDDPYRFFRW